jgi:hypothetical protein
VYIIFKLGKLKFAAATKDEYLVPQTKESLECKKGLRLQFKNYIYKLGKGLTRIGA